MPHQEQQRHSNSETPRLASYNRSAAQRENSNLEIRDFTSYLKFRDSEASITFINGSKDSHKYTFSFSQNGHVEISVQDVTGGIRLFRYYEDSSANLTESRDLSLKLSPLLKAFMSLLSKNTPNVTKEEAQKILNVAYLKAGIRSNMEQFVKTERFILDPKQDLNTDAESQTIMGSAQLEYKRTKEYQCLSGAIGLSLATYSINLRSLKEFNPPFSRPGQQSPSVEDIYKQLRRRAFTEGTEIGGGCYALKIIHDKQLIGTFYCHRSQVGDAPQQYKDLVHNASFGTMTFMRYTGPDQASRDPQQVRNQFASHAGFVSQSGKSGGVFGIGSNGAEVTHYIKANALKDRIEEHTSNEHKIMGINSNWEVSGILVPAKGIVIMPSDPVEFDKKCVDVALVTKKGSSLNDDISLDKLVKHLAVHSDFFKGNLEDHIRKAVLDMNADRFTGNSLFNMRSKPGIAIRMPLHWVEGLDLKHLTINKEGKQAGYLYIPR